MDAAFPEGMVESIQRFFADEQFRSPGRDSYHEVFESPLFFPLQRRRELAAMILQAKKVCPTTVMEIGADKGGGLYHWCKCLPSVRRVIACEIRGVPYAIEFEHAFPQVKFSWHGISSLQSVGLVEKFLLGGKIDVLFIDGDKKKFLADFDAYRPLVSDRGIVFMHDINDPGSPMRAAFEQVKARGYICAEVIDTTESAEAKVLELAGIPPMTPHEAWLRHWGGRSCGVGAIWMREGLR